MDSLVTDLTVRQLFDANRHAVIYFVLYNPFKMYRQSPVKSPDIKNIIVVTLTFLLEKFPTALKKLI